MNLKKLAIWKHRKRLQKPPVHGKNGFFEKIKYKLLYKAKIWQRVWITRCHICLQSETPSPNREGVFRFCIKFNWIVRKSNMHLQIPQITSLLGKSYSYIISSEIFNQKKLIYLTFYRLIFILLLREVTI